MNFIEELEWRGLISDIMPGTKELLEKEKIAGYIGFDPTADSLHIGSMVQIILLRHFQNAGHTPVALIGGATGMVGDPSGKSDERNLLSEAQLAINIGGVKKQLSRFLNFEASAQNAAVMVNNYDWFKPISFIDFLRDVGKHITVNYMMSKDSVKKRIEGDTGISYTEFAYQLMQGYDYVWLYEHNNCKLQMGGSDQWGNITTGTELIRRKLGGEAYAVTSPLITKADGGKFGKTEKGNIWLDAEKTSPYEFYQFWRNATDVDAVKWLKIFTFLDKQTIESIIATHEENPSECFAQKTLAEEITVFVHGRDEFNAAIETTKKVFENQKAAAENLSIEDLDGLKGVSKYELAMSRLEENLDIVSLLAETAIYPSRGSAKKDIEGGGISVNRKKVESISQIIEANNLLHNKYLLVQKGKKNYYLVEFK